MNLSNVGRVRSGISKVSGVGAAGGVGPAFDIGEYLMSHHLARWLLGSLTQLEGRLIDEREVCKKLARCF